MNERPTPETDEDADDLASAIGGFIDRLKRDLAEAREELEDWRNAAKGAENPCPDEVHCTCVPLLHKQLKDAREREAKLRAALTACMDIIGPPESLSDECWKTTDEINAAWNAGKEALEA